ncbi:hypothetical protein F5Y07DRAFT_382606 [Xylaria sp. FL0933]|nr:hypothetical protein F5Y07DRAFT_382606 [Xylaria sp. FL0933]
MTGVEQVMDNIRQSIAEIDSAIIEARQWLNEATTDHDVEYRQSEINRLEADLIAQQARLDAILQEQMNNAQ